MNVKIIMDSSANLTFMQNIAFTSVPLKIVTNEKEYVDNEQLDIAGMVEDLRAYKGRSGTSCPGVGDWLEAFGDAEEIYCVTITSGLSGSYNAAQTAKQQYEEENPGRRVCLLDSLSAGPEMKLIGEKLKELIFSGMSYEEIEREIKDYMTHTSLNFSLESLKNLANNGRVNPAIAKLSGVLGIRVTGQASLQGTLQPKEKCRGEKKALVAIWKDMKARGYVGGKVRIDHCYNEKAAEILKNMILEEFAAADIKIGTTGALCSFYAEKGGLMIGFEMQ